MAERDPSIVTIRQVPIGIVKYHGRIGSMRQGRNEFPAFVLKQHQDDGTLDLLVFFEAEDHIWEQRVSPWSETNPGHSWSPLQITIAVDRLEAAVKMLNRQIYGDYNPPDKSMIEYLDDFDKRLSALEAKSRN